MQLKTTAYLLAPIVLGASSLPFIFSPSGNNNRMSYPFSFLNLGGGIQEY
ncbi:hypothetical protein [Mycoplasma suis]|nr:hypothetical protein [Mycoplasma suis]